MPGWLDSAPTLTAEQTRLDDVHLVGNYAVSPHWGDGHHTGYYRSGCSATSARARPARRPARTHGGAPRDLTHRRGPDRSSAPCYPRRPAIGPQEACRTRWPPSIPEPAPRPRPRRRAQRVAPAGRRPDGPTDQPARTSTASCPGSSSTRASSTRRATPRNPLLERAKFLAIFAGNLDEFFQVRIAGLRQQVEAGAVARAPDGLTPAEQLAAARERVLELVDRALGDLPRPPRASSPPRASRSSTTRPCPEHHDALRQRFLDEIFPVLTPLAVDPGHPFPYISTLSLSIAVGLRDPETGERVFARVKVPPILPRLLEIEPSTVRARSTRSSRPTWPTCSPGMEVVETHLFRVTRNADFDDRGGRGRRPADGHRGGAPAPALRRGGPARGRAVDAGRRPATC